MQRQLDWLAAKWLEAKTDETAAIEQRRQVESELLKFFDVPADYEGAKTVPFEGGKVSVVFKLTRKVDYESLLELARTEGLERHLPALFRFKAEYSASGWKGAGKEVKPLLKCVTAAPAKPSIKVERS